MRIITGKAKGLRLKTAAGLNTRPTSDRVKESLFSILNGLINFNEVNAVLDIFAGTGALGLESVSRGANSAVFIDREIGVLVENIRRTKFDKCRVLRDDFMKAMNKLAGQNLRFDLIFSDPPYHKNLAQISMNLAAELNLPAENGLLVVEHSADEIFDSVPEKFECIRKINYGHTTAIEIFRMKGSNV